MKIDEIRPGVWSLTLTTHELSTVLAGARMSLAIMKEDVEGTTSEARTALEAVLGGFDSALARRSRGGEAAE